MRIHGIRPQILMAVLTLTVFWTVVSCSLVHYYQCLGGTHCSNFRAEVKKLGIKSQ